MYNNTYKIYLNKICIAKSIILFFSAKEVIQATLKHTNQMHDMSH